MNRNDEKVILGLGKRLAQVREAHGWTQKQLAAAVGVTQGAVSQLEKRDVPPSMAAVVRMAAAFNLSLDYLVLGKKDDYTPAERRFLSEVDEFLRHRRGRRGKSD